MAKVILELEDSNEDIIITVKFFGGLDKEKITPAQQLAAALCTGLNDNDDSINPEKN